MNPNLETTTLKKDILKFIQGFSSRSISFVQLEEFFDSISYNYKGDYWFKYLDKNIVIWSDWSLETIDLIRDLLKEWKITLDPCDIFIYVVDGKCLDLPIAKTNRDFKNTHWLPMMISLALPQINKKNK